MQNNKNILNLINIIQQIPKYNQKKINALEDLKDGTLICEFVHKILFFNTYRDFVQKIRFSDLDL